jgi:hypothetical protein
MMSKSPFFSSTPVPQFENADAPSSQQGGTILVASENVARSEKGCKAWAFNTPERGLLRERRTILSLKFDPNKRARHTDIPSIGSRVYNAPILPDSPALDATPFIQRPPVKASPVFRANWAPRLNTHNMSLLTRHCVFDPLSALEQPMPMQPKVSLTMGGKPSPDTDRAAQHGAYYLPSLDFDFDSEEGAQDENAQRPKGLPLQLRQRPSPHLPLPF